MPLYLKKKILARMLALLLVITPALNARNIYVAASGSRGDSAPYDGSPSQPYATINKAASVAAAGDVVIIGDGTYKPTTRIRPAYSGSSASAVITYRAANRDQAIIDGQSTVPNLNADGRKGLFEISGKSWIVVDGLRVINSGFFGIWAEECSNITIKNCSTFNTYASGIIANKSNNIKVLNNWVQRACVYPSSIVPTNEGITIASVNTFEVANNDVFDRKVDLNVGGEGIDAKSACLNGSIHDNTIYDLVRLGLYVDAFSSNLSNVEVYANRILLCGGGIVVGSEEGGPVNNVKVHDNVMRDCNGSTGIRLAGYLENGPLKNIFVYQNTIVRCGNIDPLSIREDCGILVEANNPQNSNFQIRNNIIVQNNANTRYIRTQKQSYLTLDRNLVFGTVESGGDNGTNAVLGDPQFVSLNDFHLMAGSAAINKVYGSPLSTNDYDGKLRGAGGQGDLGAYEF